MNFTEAYDDTSTSIGLAARLGDVHLLKELLNKNHPSNCHDNRGWRPLHEAAYNGHVECVCLLLTADVEVDALTHEGATALQLACRQSPRHGDVVKHLLKAGADPNMKEGDAWVLPLPTAVTNNNISIVKQLVDAGADVNQEDFSSGLPLHVAAEQGLLDIAEFLLENKADINKCDASGRNALHVLMFSRVQNEVIKSMLTLLLRKGIDVNVQMNDGTTPLMLAVQRKWKHSVMELLHSGADVNISKVDGVLALHFAIEFCSTETDTQSDKDICDEDESSSSIEHPFIMKSILDLTDRSLIIPKSPEPIKYSLYHLAIEWDRFSCLKKMVEANIPPDSFLQETSNAVLDEADVSLFRQVPLVLPLDISVDTPLGFLLSKPFTRERIDAAKFMIIKGCAVNAINCSCLPPIVAAVKHQRNSYSNNDLGCEILEFLLEHGIDVMYKIRENDVLPVALYVAALFNVAALFKILQFGVPTSQVFSPTTLQALSEQYRSSSFYTIYPLFPWRVISWLQTINMFVPQLKLDTDIMFDQHRMVDDENLSNAWKNFSKVISSPKSLQQLCVIAVREAVGNSRGWPNLGYYLKQLNDMNASLPVIIMDLLLFNQVQQDTLFYCPPRNAMLSYLSPESPTDSEDGDNSVADDLNDDVEVPDDDDDDSERESDNSYNESQGSEDTDGEESMEIGIEDCDNEDQESKNKEDSNQDKMGL